MTKPPSRKHHEKSEVQHLKDRIAKLEKEKPEALGIRNTIEGLRAQVKVLKTDAEFLHRRLVEAGKYEAYFSTLSREEVFVAGDDGMKYLKGEDLEAYCKSIIQRQLDADRERHAGYETINLGFTGFKGFADGAISQFLREEVDKLALHQTVTYKTKGRYDSGSKSKKEGS